MVKKILKRLVDHGMEGEVPFHVGIVGFYVKWFCVCENKKYMQWVLCLVTASPRLNLKVWKNVWGVVGRVYLCGMSAEETPRWSERWSTSPMRKGETTGIVQPGKEILQGHLSPFSTWRELAGEMEQDFWQGYIVTEQGVMASNWEEV